MLVNGLAMLLIIVLHATTVAGPCKLANELYTHQPGNDTVPPEINREMLEMFERFREKGAVSGNFISRFVNEADSQSAERFRQLLEEYRGAKALGEDPLEHEEFVELLAEEVDAWMAEETDTEPIKPQKEEKIVVEPDKFAEEPVVPDTTSPFIAAPGMQNMVRYHVQIAASTLPLSHEYLSGLFSGAGAVKSFEEDGWIKYYTGHFYSFAEAREALRNIDVEGAFITAYVNDYKLLAYRGRLVERVFSETTLQTFHNDPDDQFRVQIAANVRPLSDDQLRNIFPNIEKIGIIFEDGWFKYSIPAASDLSHSWEITRATGIEGAYVVRYKNGRLLPLR